VRDPEVNNRDAGHVTVWAHRNNESLGRPQRQKVKRFDNVCLPPFGISLKQALPVLNLTQPESSNRNHTALLNSHSISI
jgi:hypothetical protein